MNFLTEVFEGFFITILITILVTIFVTEIFLRKRAPGSYIMLRSAANSIKYVFGESTQICVGEHGFSQLSTVNPCFRTHTIIFRCVRRTHGILWNWPPR